LPAHGGMGEKSMRALGWLRLAGLPAGCGGGQEAQDFNIAKANYDTAIEDLKACRQGGPDANCSTEPAIDASRERVYKSMIDARGAERAAAAANPGPDYSGMTATGLMMMQMGQPQYQQPVNVYVQQPAAPAIRMPTGRW